MTMNYVAYESHSVVALFRQMAQDGLTMQEKYCLEFVPSSNRNSILDLGVGAGRTTGPLLKLFDKYIGVDYSENMIVAARSFYPGVDFRTMDARKLDLKDKCDCVMFSYNGIDYVNYSDRQIIFRQVANVLKTAGYFVYSTHNLHNRRVSNWLNSLIVIELGSPLRGFFRPWTKVRPIRNRLANFWRQAGDQSQPFAYVNDIAEEFGLLTTYVDIREEIETLRQHGFMVVATIGNTKRIGGYDTDDSWVYIVAKSVG